MREEFHLPAIDFPEGVPGDLRLLLTALIRDSIRRAAGDSGSEDVSPPAPGRAQPVGERAALDRFDAAEGTYAVPSYRDAGALVAVSVRNPAETAKKLFAPRWEHPRGEGARDLVADDCPLAGEQLAALPGGAAVRLRGGRYAISTDLRRALTWGSYLFGPRPYAVLEGPMGGAERRYLSVAATASPARSRPATPQPRRALKERGVRTVKEPIVWQPQVYDHRRTAYLLRGLVVAPGEVMWPPDPGVVEEFYDELEECDERNEALPRDVAREQLFAAIDRLITVGRNEEAVALLVELGAAAFLLLEWDAKEKYLALLCGSAPREAGEGAIVAILASLRSNAELEAALDVLRRNRWPR